MDKDNSKSQLSCSFCHKPQAEVDKIIAGPGVQICSECIKLCLNIIHDNANGSTVSWSHQGTPIPHQITDFLDKFIIGQDKAKRKIAVAVYNHYKRLESKNSSDENEVEIQKANVLLIGPTGTGKTLIAQTLARLIDVPFIIADATSLTSAGYVGEDVENIILRLYQAADSNVDKTIRGIIYVDEIDKVARKEGGSSAGRDVSGEGVQQALLKILEGTLASIQVRSKKGLPNQETVNIDTTDILFICGGSFEGLETLIEQRLGRRSVGFHHDEVNLSPDDQKKELLKQLRTEDLERFGLIPEFIGRLPVIAVMNHLEADDLAHILTEPQNALVKQYQKLLKFERVDLSFTDDAILAIAKRAIERKSGARGLRSIVETVMLDVMYEVPSIDDVSQVIISADVVNKKAKPEYVIRPDAEASS